MLFHHLTAKCVETNEIVIAGRYSNSLFRDNLVERPIFISMTYLQVTLLYWFCPLQSVETSYMQRRSRLFEWRMCFEDFPFSCSSILYLKGICVDYNSVCIFKHKTVAHHEQLYELSTQQLTDTLNKHKNCLSFHPLFVQQNICGRVKLKMVTFIRKADTHQIR